MTLEEQLKAIILEKYKSVRAFTQEIGIPYSTLDNILKRPNGIKNAGLSLITTIFNALDVDIKSIPTGILAPKKHPVPEDRQPGEPKKAEYAGYIFNFEPVAEAINKALTDAMDEVIKDVGEEESAQIIERIRRKLRGDTDEGRKTP